MMTADRDLPIADSPLVNGYVLVAAEAKGRAYGGPDRAPWEVIDVDYYGDGLPPALRASYEALKSNDAWGLSCERLEDAFVFRDHAHRRGHSVEVMAVFSPYLERVRGLRGWPEPKAVLSGFDVLAVGEWSLLRAILETPRCAGEPLGAELLAMLNERGLLFDPALAGAVEASYRELAAAGVVEPIAERSSRLPAESTAAYRLRSDRV